MKPLRLSLLTVLALSSNAMSADACLHVDDQVSERECNIANADRTAKEVEKEEGKVRDAIAHWDAETELKEEAAMRLSESAIAYRAYRSKVCALSSAPAMYGRGQEDMRLICTYQLNMAYIKRLQDASREFDK